LDWEMILEDYHEYQKDQEILKTKEPFLFNRHSKGIEAFHSQEVKRKIKMDTLHFTHPK